jgi:hypothetical protein
MQPVDIVPELLMKRTTCKGLLVLCEGDTDARVFERFLATERCTLHSCDGKGRVLAAFRAAKTTRLGPMVGIVDADFWPLQGVRPPQSVFTTDAHDLDMQMLLSDALNVALREICDGPRLQRFLDNQKSSSFLEWASKRAVVPGAARFVNEISACRLKFSGVDPGYYLRGDLLFESDSYLEAVVKNSAWSRVSLRDLKRRVSQQLAANHDLRWLLNGHDVVSIMASACRHEDFKNRVAGYYTVRNVEAAVRLAYDSVFFRRSRTYADLRNWQTSSGSVLLAC